LNKGEFEYIEIEKEMSLTCENKKWKIILDAKKQAQIKELMQYGLKAATEKKYEEAATFFREILKIDENNELASLCLKRLEYALKEEKCEN